MSGVVRNLRAFTIILISLMGISANAEQLSVKLNTGNYEIITLPDGFFEIRMENFGNLLTPGKPMLPSKTFLIAIPPGAEINSVEVEGIGAIELDGKYRITPAPFVFPMDERKDLIKEATEIYQHNKNICYSSDRFYPEKVGWYAGKGGLRKYNFVRVTFAPFAYNPVSGKLIFYQEARVIIDYSISPTLNKKSIQSDFLMGDRIAEKQAANILLNFNEAKNWYPSTKKPPASSQIYNYVIVTTDALQSSVSTFVSWKQSVGFAVNVVTISWINNNYSGSDLPQKIRNFLIDKYAKWGIEYVLLVGDV